MKDSNHISFSIPYNVMKDAEGKMGNTSNTKTLWPRFIINLAREIPADPVTKAILVTFVELVFAEQNSLDQKLDVLIASYYKKGGEYLNDAVSVNESRRVKWIEASLDEFMTASSVESPLMSAKSKFFVGVCYDLLHESKVALIWYEKAYMAGRALISDASLNASETFFEYVGGQKKKAMEELLNLLPFLMPLSKLLVSRSSSLHTLQVDDVRNLRNRVPLNIWQFYREYIKELENEAFPQRTLDTNLFLEIIRRQQAVPKPPNPPNLTNIERAIFLKSLRHCPRCQKLVFAPAKICGSCGSPMPPLS